MKRVHLILMATLLIAGTINAQNLNSFNGIYENRRIINKKKFHVLYEEVAIDKTVDEVWTEVAGNFVNIGDIAKAINFSHSESGDVTEGIGAARYCSINFKGKTVEIKERIIDFRDCGDNREFTYDVYETKGFPAKVYNTWVVRKGDDGKTYLGTVFMFRANFAPMTRVMEKKLIKSGGLRNGILTYKHYLETGEKGVDPKKLNELYSLK